MKKKIKKIQAFKKSKNNVQKFIKKQKRGKEKNHKKKSKK